MSNLSRLLKPADRLPLKDRMREDAEVFLDDFQKYAARQTDKKKRQALETDYETLRLVYLGE